MKTLTSAKELTRALRGLGCKVHRQSPTWRFEFSPDLNINVECLWRLGDRNGLVVTSEDDGHQFGLPSSVDAETEFNSALDGLVVKKVTISVTTSDLVIDFGGGLQLDIVPDSAGYEAWQMWLNGGLIVGHGGRAL